MTDLVSQLVGALEASRAYIARYGYTGEQLAIIDAALTNAKAGGWVAVPVEPTPEMCRAGAEAIDGRKQGRAQHCYAAMLAARPTTPPKEQSAGGLGLVDPVAHPRSAAE